MTKKEIIEAIKKQIEKIENGHNLVRKKHPICYQEPTDGEPDVCKYLRPIWKRDQKIIGELRALIDDIEKGTKTERRSAAAANASEARKRKARAAVQNAVNLARMQGRKPTAYFVSKTSGVALQTAKKYLEEILSNKSNQED